MTDKNIILRLYKNMTDKTKFSLEHRILNVFIILVSFLSLSAAVGNYLIGLGIMTIIATLVCGIIMTYCAYLSIIKKSYRLAANIAINVIMFIFFPIIYFANGGFSGSVPYFFIVFSGAIVILNRGVKKTTSIIMYIVAIAALIAIEYNYPNLVVGYESEYIKFSDMTTGLSIALVVNALLFDVVLKNYSYEHDRAEKLNRQLTEEKKKLEKLSFIDGLTEIYNHRYIIGYMERAIENCQKKNGSLTAIFLDIDNFKDVNDTYGHTYGDYVLRRVSKAIKQNLRDSDLVGRYGGEEFLIVLPGKDLEVGYNIADRIRREISYMDWDSGCRITVSGGVAEFANERLCELLDKADKLLYIAKELGKNRIEK